MGPGSLCDVVDGKRLWVCRWMKGICLFSYLAGAERRVGCLLLGGRGCDDEELLYDAVRWQCFGVVARGVWMLEERSGVLLFFRLTRQHFPSESAR